MIRMFVVGVVAVLTLGLAACAGQDGAAIDAGAGGAAGACPRGAPDCNDTPELDDGEPVEIDDTGIAQLREDAKFYLGAREDELSDAVRIGRIGDEDRQLTADYQVGRITVELDDVDGDGTFVVTSATVELPDGAETFTLEE